MAHKHLKTIKTWEQANPGYETSNKGMDKYFQKTRNILPATDTNAFKEENTKIIKKVAQVTHIKDAMDDIKN